MPVILDPRRRGGLAGPRDARRGRLHDAPAPARRPRPALRRGRRPRSTTRATTSRTACDPPAAADAPPRRCSRPPWALAPRRRPYDHVLLDLDGCVWVGDEPTPRRGRGGRRAAGGRPGWPSSRTTAATARRTSCASSGASGSRPRSEEVVTVGGAVQFVLRAGAGLAVGRRHRRARHPPPCRRGRPARSWTSTTWPPRPTSVVVAAHDDLRYDELREATQRAAAPAPRCVCAGRDATFPMPDGPWPGTGAGRRRPRGATGVTARNVGKPDAELFRTALDRLGARPRRSSVGDRLDADVGGARAAAGIDGADRAHRQHDRAPRRAPPSRRPALSAADAGRAGARPVRHGPARRRPDRQPHRRRRPRRCARCPRSRRACATLGVAFRTRAHARPRPRAGSWPRAAARRARWPSTLVGRRAHRRGRRRAARHARRACSASCPAGAATTSRASLGIPRDPVAALRRDRATASRAPLDLGDGRRARRSSASPASASTPTPTGSPTRRPSRLGDARLRLRRAARAGRLAARRASRSSSTAQRARASPAGAWARRTPRPTAAGMYAAPGRRARRRRCSTSCCATDDAEAALPARCCRGSSRARTSSSPRSTSCAAPRSAIAADRPFTVYADGDPIAELPRHAPGAARRALRVLVPR